MNNVINVSFIFIFFIALNAGGTFAQKVVVRSQTSTLAVLFADEELNSTTILSTKGFG